MTKEELVNAIAELTVLELSELVKAIEEKFGVKAAAPAVAVAAAAPAAAAAAEEKDEFNVVLTAVDAAKKNRRHQSSARNHRLGLERSQRLG